MVPSIRAERVTLGRETYDDFEITIEPKDFLAVGRAGSHHTCTVIMVVTSS